jgi:hypothetical protein
MSTAGMVLACLCAGSAQAQAPAGEPAGGPRALHEYRSTTQHALVACGSPFARQQAASRAAGALAQYRSCVAKMRGEVAARLDAAVRSLAGTGCVGALHNYQVVFERALAGIEPQPGESPLAYEQRQTFLFHTVAHAWGGFEIAESFAQ